MAEPSRSQQRDDAAFQRADEETPLAALSAAFRPGLVRYFCRRVSNRHDVDDLVQEVFLRLLRRGNVHEMDQVRGYVFQTASSVFQDWLRHRKSHSSDRHELFQPERHADADFPTDRVLEGQERLRQATAVLLELPERTRNVFVLRRVEGMRLGDIAVRLGISVSAVEKHLRRAVVHITGRMIEHEQRS